MTVLGPVLEKIQVAINTHTTATVVAEVQALQIEVGALRKEVQVLAGIVGEKKKTIARAPKTEAVTNGVVTTNDTPIPQAVGTKKSFAGNKLIYFRENYKASQEFRDKYTTDEIKALIADDKTCKTKTQPEQKLVAECNFCWNHIKNTKKDIMEAIELEYKTAKKAYEEAHEPPQQNAEEHTPENS